jgi:5-methylcytosine-specific restriction endonuclease McrA
MNIIQSLTCECNPGKVYASKSTFSSHIKSRRHQQWEVGNESKHVRIRSETEIRRLKRRIVQLEQLVQDLCTKPRGRRVSEAVKKRVASSQSWKCAECEVMLPSCYEVDHVIPLWKHGSNDVTNLRALCRNCHGCKTQSDLMD